MSRTGCFIAFIAGVAVGSAAVWQYSKQKYEKIAQEEIDSVREVFSKKKEAANVIKDVKQETVEHINEKPDILEYASILRKEHYTGKEENMEQEKPYVIEPDEFGSMDEYESVSLTYYADNILTDDDDEIIEDVENIVGFDSLNHFGEYEDDSVFVRNDNLKCDYEILLDQRKFSDVMKAKPHQIGV